MAMFFARISLALLSLALAACGREVAPTGPGSAPGQARLADARLSGLYERSCANCHDVAGTGAPQRGERAAWAPREAGGLPSLVASVRAGKGAMPPMGWCPECTDEDFAVLVSYLRGVQ